MSHTISRFMTSFCLALTKPLKPYRKAITRALISENMCQTWTVKTKNKEIRFNCPSARSLHDIATLDDNEPETLNFLNKLTNKDVLWDIGANVGVFTIYASKINKTQVVAFEPSASSYATLIKNIEINKVSTTVNAYNIALHNKNKLSYLFMENTESGHSMHSFDNNKNAMGKIKTSFKQSVLGFTIDQFFQQFKPLPPSHIKIDVDGNELLVLKGGEKVIKKYVKSFIIETESFSNKRDREKLIKYIYKLGFVEEDFNKNEGYRNKIFIKK